MIVKITPTSILLYLTFSLGCLNILGCDTDENTTSNTTSIVSEPYTASFRGTIVNTNGDPVEGASVIVGTDLVSTDETGYWTAIDVPMPAGPAYVRIEAQGYMHGSRTVFAKNDRTYELQIQLLSSTPIATVQTSTGGDATFNGATLSLPSGALKRSDGSSFEGAYQVAAHYLDPTGTEMLDQMPGDLRGIPMDATGSEETLLTSYGMIAVELSANGEKLNLADGVKAELTFPIPADARASAPATIPLWYFDEDEGIWLEEGFAERIGNAYVGEVSHFSFWNCDIPTDYAYVCINVGVEAQTLTGTDTTLADNWIVYIESQNFGITSGSTDETGQVCGYVPANEILTVTINDPCGDPMYTTTIGPFAPIGQAGGATTVVEIDLITPPQNSRLNVIRGRAMCNGVPVANGIVSIIQNGRILGVEATNSNGRFFISATSCSTDSLELTIRDLDAALQSTTTLAFDPGIRNLGDVEVCVNQLTNFIQINVEGQPFWVSPDFFVQVLPGDSLHMWIQPTQSTPGMRFVADLRANSTSTIRVGDFGLTNGGYLEVEYPTTPTATQMQFFLGGSTLRISHYEPTTSGATELKCEILPIVLTDTQSGQQLEVSFELSAGF